MSLQSRVDRLEKTLGVGQPTPPACTCSLPIVVWDDALEDAPDGESICPKCGGLRYVVRWESFLNGGDAQG